MCNYSNLQQQRRGATGKHCSFRNCVPLGTFVDVPCCCASPSSRRCASITISWTVELASRVVRTARQPLVRQAGWHSYSKMTSIPAAAIPSLSSGNYSNCCLLCHYRPFMITRKRMRSQLMQVVKTNGMAGKKQYSIAGDSCNRAVRTNSYLKPVEAHCRLAHGHLR